MKARLGRDTERTMYHGTSSDTVDKITKRGFNRSFSGKNGEDSSKNLGDLYINEKERF